MKLYTKTGDKGQTSLFGGQRVSKSSDRVEAYGTVDELNSYLGVVRLHTKTWNQEDLLLKQIQNDLFILGADLATPADSPHSSKVPRIDELHISILENKIDFYQEGCPPFEFFVLPGGIEAAAHLHVARTICRRAERIVVKMQDHEDEYKEIIVYLNRLSDLLFIMARYANLKEGVVETEWKVDNRQ